jgi:CBS domain-containing protein
MSRDVLTVPVSATLSEVARTLRRRNVGSAVVVGEDGTPVGIIAERELVDAVAASRNPDVGTAQSWMKELRPVPPGTSIAEAAEIMREHGVRHLPVFDGGLAGVVSIRDLLAGAV